MTGSESQLYSAENAQRFEWAGFSDRPLEQDRVRALDQFVLGSQILDAGCGSGAFVDYFSKRGYDVTGIDLHQFCLDVAYQRGYLGRFVQGDLTEKLPFDDKSFDTSICCDVLEHVDDVKVLQELSRVTKHRIILTVPQDGRWLTQYRLLLPTYQDHTHLRYYTLDMANALAKSIPHQSIVCQGEQAVDIIGFIRHFLWPQSKIPGMGRIYNRLVKHLLCRTPDPNLAINWLIVIDLPACNIA